VSEARRRRTPVYAIVRIDNFQDETVSLRNKITVSKVVLDEADARGEVERLNKLNGDKGCTYFWQATRLLEPE
jgi:hypothetical protein